MTLPVFTAGTGPPVVALHGFLGRGADWADLAGRLPGFTLFAPDLPGHGDALGLPPGAYTMAGAAAAVLATLDAHGIRQAPLLGYSMGGRLALYLALHAPERFGRVVLESASPGLRTEAERAARRRLDAARADDMVRDLGDFLTRWYAMPLFASTPPDQRRRLIARRRHNQPAELARSLREMGTGAQPDLWGKMPNLAVPALVVAGASDAKFVALAREMKASSPQVQVAIIPGAGHTVHADAPAAFAACVRSFLAG